MRFCVCMCVGEARKNTHTRHTKNLFFFKFFSPNLFYKFLVFLFWIYFFVSFKMFGIIWKKGAKETEETVRGDFSCERINEMWRTSYKKYKTRIEGLVWMKPISPFIRFFISFSFLWSSKTCNSTARRKKLVSYLSASMMLRQSKGKRFFFLPLRKNFIPALWILIYIGQTACNVLLIYFTYQKRE